MWFTQLEFPIFFLAVLAAAWFATKVEVRNLTLLVASYYFYAYWDYRFCSLLLVSTVVDYWAAQRIFTSVQPGRRRGWLLVSLAVNLGMLGYFKYCDFFIDSASVLLQSFGLSGKTLGIILPVGISFFTFQTLSYTIDVYRNKLKPTVRFVDFALYVSFFPQLVAGPIVRARELLPQLSAMPEFSRRRMYGGAQLFLRGAVKKVLIADRLGEMVDVVFAGPDLYSGITVWIAVIAYAGQIYYDFCGYSDMAIGAAKMLGYRFPANFRHPYLSTSMAEFWHRWHMTLSRWLRDYLYIPLGGNRDGGFYTYRNLMITMALGGLWHGAAWTFLIWGVWHGAALAVERSRVISIPAAKPVRWFMTMMVVLVGWVFFRANGDFGKAMMVLNQMATLSSGIDWFPPLALSAIGLAVTDHLVWRTRLRKAMRLPATAWYSPIATAIMIWALLLYAPRGFQPFVYFQF